MRAARTLPPSPLLGVLVLALGGLLLASCAGELDEGAPPAANSGGGNSGANNTPFNNSGDGEARDPGRKTLHRLNRAEYNNTLRDLLGTSQRPADDFPADDHGYGFDNIADVLSLSPLLLELYERAAEQVVEEVLHVPRTEPDVFQAEAEALSGSVGAAWREQGWNLWSNGSIGPSVEIAEAGRYRIAVRAFGQQAGDALAKMAINVNGLPAQIFDVAATQDNPEVYTVEVELEAGLTQIEAEFLNDYYDPDASQDRNLIVDWFEVVGPLDVEGGVNPLRERLVTCDPAQGEACAAEILGGLAPRAWRRPLEAGELERLLGLYRAAVAEGAGFDEALGWALRGVLVSPHFIYRVEVDPGAGEAPRRLSDFELASRLSYFLWSSMPDDALFELASSGQLRDPEVLKAQVDRMLDDPRSQALVENFAGQWLYTRALVDVQPDYQYFPGFDESLRQAMRQETELFFGVFLREDLGVDELFSADFTFLNDRLAQHYGLPSPGSGEAMVRVQLGSEERRGLLTQGSVLTVTSYPTRTSPVKRGKWVLTQLLCSEPPPPPPGVEGLATEVNPTATLRERLEQHRSNPECAVCHQIMDPVGFGMERYDGIGSYRDMDRGGFPIDATGELPGLGTFDGALELSDVIAGHEELPTCVTEQLMTYALGRGMQRSDQVWVEEVASGFASDGMRLRALIKRIVLSPPFQYRRGEEGG